MGFLVSPEYALGLALRLRRELDAAPVDGLLRSRDLRLGINLGPLKVVTDVNGHPNLVGEGINSAERIMSFADPGDITASRSFRRRCTTWTQASRACSSRWACAPTSTGGSTRSFA